MQALACDEMAKARQLSDGINNDLSAVAQFLGLLSGHVVALGFHGYRLDTALGYQCMHVLGEGQANGATGTTRNKKPGTRPGVVG